MSEASLRVGDAIRSIALFYTGPLCLSSLLPPVCFALKNSEVLQEKTPAYGAR